MRTWQVDTFYPIYEGDTVTHTHIQISSRTNGFATFGETVAGDHRNKPDDQKIQLALDAYFKSEYADKAMAESVQVVEELANWKAEAAPLLEAMKAATIEAKASAQDAKAATEENRQLMRTISLTLNEALDHIYGETETEDAVDDKELIEEN